MLIKLAGAERVKRCLLCDGFMCNDDVMSKFHV